MPKIIIDTGTGYCKSGFSGDDCPRSLFRTRVGDSKNGKEPLVGDEAVIEPNILYPKKPAVERGVPYNFKDFEILLSAIFNYDLRVNSKEYDVLFCETVLTEDKIQEKCIELFFDEFEVQNYVAVNQGILSLFATAKITGLTVDSGFGNTSFVPVYEGNLIGNDNGVVKIDKGGYDFNIEFMDMLNRKGVAKIYGSKGFEMLETIKSQSETYYELPDGSAVLEKTIDCAADTVFKFLPDCAKSFLQEADFSSHLKESLNSSGLREEIESNILVTGGNSLLPGFIEALDTQHCKLHDYNKNSAWVGGSILAELSSFDNFLMSKQEYEESGSTSVLKRFQSKKFQ